MKWFVIILFFILLGSSSPIHIFAGQKTYKIAGESALPPFSYENEQGKLSGLTIDLMNKVANENGVHFKYIPMEIHEAEKALKKGKIDAIAGITYSTEKDREFDFSIPYFTMSNSLIVPASNQNKVKGIADIRDLHVVLENNSPVLSTLLNMRNTNLTLTTNEFSGLLTLIQGRADVFVGNKWTTSFYLKKWKQEKNYVIRDEVIEPADYTIAVKEGNHFLLSMINKSLTDLKAKGEVNILVDAWLRPQNEDVIVKLKQFIYFLVLFMSIGVLIFFAIYIWNQRLKKAVNAQTRKLLHLNEDLKRQRQSNADSNAFKEQILNNIDTGIITFEMDRTISSCNKRALEILDITSTLNYRLQDSPIYTKLFENNPFKQLSQQGDGAIFHTLETNDEGKRKVIYYSMHKMFDSMENEIGYLLSINDETEKKKLEQKLLTQEKLHALGQLVAGVAHEIRNPLTSIKTFIDLLPSKYDRPQFREVLMKHLPAEVNRLNMIVTDLIEYARPRPPNIQSCSAYELTSLLAFLQVTMNKYDIEFEQTIEQGLIFFIDPQQIRQVLLNLLLNAIHAVEKTNEKKIKIIMEKKNSKKGRILIIDTGKGMSQDEINHIFEPFYTSKEKGVGLGLTLSYNLIKENKGDIQVTSIPAQGTKFTVVLPLFIE
ncbi:transporter substrate-binding domain-containing protein [Heyndrickxia vini]|uniref:histidine kinase n=1 Tax=Heyndrickxia vini TaxID=1476025 RepID=A0ABX7DXM6_9BACI|nr:transporter substrate-binding domain-containing protein [Heyndrickxia vini]QQZ07729.1 transporter substrate-binding domain-containing protein [Heyndrickxia vini]